MQQHNEKGAAELLRDSNGNLEIIRREIAGPGAASVFGQIANLAHESMEKSVKAVIDSHGVRYSRMHDLKSLLIEAIAAGASIDTALRQRVEKWANLIYSDSHEPSGMGSCEMSVQVRYKSEPEIVFPTPNDRDDMIADAEACYLWAEDIIRQKRRL